MKKLNKLKFITLSLFLISFMCISNSCDEMDKKNSPFVRAIGNVGEILVIMDSTKWKGNIGRTLREILEKDMPGLFVPESRFRLNYIHPDNFFGVVKRRRKVLFLTVLDDNSVTGKKLKSYFSKESLSKLKDKPNSFMIPKKNVYAEGQNVLHIFGRSEREILENLRKHHQTLYEYYIKLDNKLLTDELFGRSEAGKLSKYVQSKHDVKLRFPTGYEVAQEDSTFIWLRQLGNPVDRSIVITRQPYVSQEMFEEKYIRSLRNKFGKEKMFDASPVAEGRDTVYMKTQPVSFYTKTLNLDGSYAREYRGYWQINTGTVGGPFISYALVDKEQKNFYYIEAFLRAPSVTNKKRYMLELEAILKTIKLLKSKKSK